MKRLRDLRRLVVSHGIEVEDISMTGGGHYRMQLRLPSGESHKVFTGFSPSDGRAKKNLAAMLKRLTRR